MQLICFSLKKFRNVELIWNCLREFHFQPVLKTNAVTVASFSHYLNQKNNDSSSICPGNHGRGMSQIGSEYLEKYENYDWKRIIDYYHNGQAELKSIYKSFTGGNYEINPKADLYSNLQLLLPYFCS